MTRKQVDNAPGPRDWYVFGRIAEEYGLTNDARRFYGQVLEQGPVKGNVFTSFALAEKRLKVLKKSGEENG